MRERLVRSLSGALMVVAAFALLAANPAFGQPAAQNPKGRSTRISGSVSGSTLTVQIVGHGNSHCAVWLGSAEDRRRLPDVDLGQHGKGLLEWPIPSDTSVGNNRLKAECGFAGVKSTAHTIVEIPQSAVSSKLTTILNVLLDIGLGVSLAILYLALLRAVLSAPPGEHFGRALALIAGALVALGAQAAGVGFAEYVVESLSGSGPTGEGAKLLSAIIPGGAAVIFGWYFARTTEDRTLKAIRWLVFLGMLTVVAFTVIFAEATSTNGVFLGASAIPNASFVVGLILSYLAFGRAEDEDDRVRRGFLGLGSRRAGKSRRNPFAED